MFEASALIPSLPLLNNLPKGDGHPIYVMPGFMADSQSTAMLRRWLDRLGYEAFPWGFGRNLGPRGNLQARMVDTVERMSAHFDQKVSLIGQSLGGIFAREIAKQIPDKVRQVITLGSPFGQTNTNGTTPAVMSLFELATGQSVEDVREELEGITSPPPVPTTAIFSRADGVASWKSCIEEETPLTDNIEVFGSHVGMSFHPTVYYVIADRLVQAEDEWRKFDRGGVRTWLFPRPVYANGAAA
jgi:pimeloyl-ACP methyl ester carboxylesterase